MEGKERALIQSVEKEKQRKHDKPQKEEDSNAVITVG